MNKNTDLNEILNPIKTKSSFNSILLDFDGTITKQDTVASFFMQFGEENWMEIEKDWIDGKIGSKECMLLQLDTIKHLTEEKLYNFLNSIEIQDGFIEFCTEAKKRRKEITIISDGFDFFISYILKKEKSDHIKFYTNHLEVLKKDNFLKFNLTFPYENKNCTSGLGSCKCAHAKAITKDENFIYAGDGLSDRCIASKANLLFAKNSLKNHCIEKRIEFILFNDFNDILNHLSLKKGMKNAGFKTENINRT